MERKFENSTFIVQAEQYESPRVEVIEMEVEGALLAASEVGGEDGTSEPW